jgi:Ser/Thr protein kinase RdoA (MazF antagonist)
MDVETWTNLHGKIARLESSVEEPFGYYRITSDNNDIYFVKILKPDSVLSQERSNEIACWLSDRGLLVNCMLDGFPKYVSNEIAVIAYPYIDGSFAKANEQDLSNLGGSLAVLHNAFRECPWKSDIEIRGKERHKELVSTLQRISTIKSGDIPNEVISFLSENAEKDLLDVLITSPQVVHGDVNYGNVLFIHSSQKIVFLDFEDTWISWFTPLMDISFAIERFALIGSDDKAVLLGRSLVNAYQKLGGIAFSYQEQLSDILRAMSVRALLLLILVEEKGAWKIPVTEWSKFLSLYEQAIQRKSVLSKISLG